MTETPAVQTHGLDRNLALVNYGLLFASVFFAGVPALIAVVIAYAQRDQAANPIRSHYNFQIRIFWIAFAVTLIGAACLVAAMVMGVGELIAFGVGGGWDAWDGLSFDFSDVTLNAGLVVALVGAVLLLTLSAIWLLAAPAFGFIRLASERRIGEQAA
jgi:uncharacterized membrane protein